MKNYLSIDQGTTSSRAIVFDSNLSPLRESQKEYDLSYPRDGWVEGNPSDIIETVKKTVEDVKERLEPIFLEIKENIGKFIDNWWRSWLVMADMKKCLRRSNNH